MMDVARLSLCTVIFCLGNHGVCLASLGSSKPNEHMKHPSVDPRRMSTSSDTTDDDTKPISGHNNVHSVQFLPSGSSGADAQKTGDDVIHMQTIKLFDHVGVRLHESTRYTEPERAEPGADPRPWSQTKQKANIGSSRSTQMLFVSRNYVKKPTKRKLRPSLTFEVKGRAAEDSQVLSVIEVNSLGKSRYRRQAGNDSASKSQMNDVRGLFDDNDTASSGNNTTLDATNGVIDTTDTENSKDELQSTPEPEITKNDVSSSNNKNQSQSVNKQTDSANGNVDNGNVDDKTDVQINNPTSGDIPNPTTKQNKTKWIPDLSQATDSPVESMPASEPKVTPEPESSLTTVPNARYTTPNELNLNPNNDVVIGAPTEENEPTKLKPPKIIKQKPDENSNIGESKAGPINQATDTPTKEPDVTGSDPEPETEPSPEDDVNAPDAEVGPPTDPEGNSENTPEPDGEVEPEIDPNTTSEFNKGAWSEPATEPGPDWELAKEQWKFAWEIHIYAFGGLFGILGLYTLLSVIRLWHIQRLLSRTYFLALNLLVLTLCVSRSFYLLFDPYNSGGSYHISLDFFLYSIAFPCLTSGFSILLYALLQATNMRLVSPSVQRLEVLVFIIVAHFVLSITTDILLGFFAGIQLLLFVCQMYFIVWGLFLFVGYAYIFRKLYKHAVKRQKTILYTNNNSASKSKTKTKYTLSAAIKVTFFTAVCGVATVGLECYAIAAVYNTFTRAVPEPWPWFLYHSVLRLIELLMAVTMAYVASQPFRYRESDKGCRCGACCAPCSEILCCGYSVNRSSSYSTAWTDCDGTSASKFHSLRMDSVNNGTTRKFYPMSDIRDSAPIVEQPSALGSRPSSLLIIEDGYVRFQTENDINRLVDSSYAGKPKTPDDKVHKMDTFLLREGFCNSAYTAQNSVEFKRKGAENVAKEDVSNVKLANKLLEMDAQDKCSFTSSEFFRIPSSVSLADSMENELEKAFESFKVESSDDERMECQLNSSDTPGDDNIDGDDDDAGSVDLAYDSSTLPRIPHLRETDLISVDSLDMRSGSQQVQKDHHSDQTSNVDHSQDNRPVTILKKAKSSDICQLPSDAKTVRDAGYPQKDNLCRSHSDHSTVSQRKHSAYIKYSSLPDGEGAENRVTNSEGNDLDLDLTVCGNRRPSNDSSNHQQAATLTSLLTSKDNESNDNIDV